MKFQLLLLTLVFSATFSGSAQYRERTLKDFVTRPGYVIYQDVYRYSPPMFSHCDLSNPLKIGDSKIHIEYELMALCDTLSTTKYQDRVICLIGDEYSWTYGESTWRTNMLYTLPNGHPGEKKYKRSKGCEEVMASSVYRNLKTGNLINYGLVPEVKNTMFRYDEKLPRMNWELTGETEEVAGYICQKAVTKYAGRVWAVWFTPEIPVDCGLWKFNGLPGLIMKAADSNDEYVFSLISIEQKREEITRYPKREKVVSREQYRKMEKNAHDDPILTSDGVDGYRLIYDETRGLTSKEVFSSGHFLYPYNPIEKQ